MSCAIWAILCAAHWQTHTIALEAVSQVAMAADAIQTTQLVTDGFVERESDCIIGHHPKATSVALYFGGLAIGHLLLANAFEKISPKLADAFEGLTIGWEAGTVVMNARIGVRF